MSRRIVRLSLDHSEALAALGGPCHSCLFWELDPVRRGRAADPAGEKEAWVATVLREWGPCGRVALVEDRPVGYLGYAPEAFVPGAASFPTSPVSVDAVLLTTAYVDPAHRGAGLGRMLMQAAAADLVRRGFDAVETFGDPTGRGRRCLLPVGFLTAVGFKIARPHPSTPRLRMDLRSTVTWRDEIEAALERLIGVVRPRHKQLTRPKLSGGSTHSFGRVNP